MPLSTKRMRSTRFVQSTALLPQAQRMSLTAWAPTPSSIWCFSDDETTAMIKEKGTYVTPTLSHRTDHAIELRRQQGTSQFVLNKMKGLQQNCFDTFQNMYKAGVNIAMGTDMGFDPEMGTNAGELEIYVKLGMSPMDALLTCTRNAARAIKMDKQVGTLETGKPRTSSRLPATRWPTSAACRKRRTSIS